MAKHFFDTIIACEYGIEESILFQNIGYWIEKNIANEKHYHDGVYWTYNSIKAFNELFPYMSKRKIATALKKLEDNGLILTGNYNKSAYDRTKWYGFTEKGKRLYYIETSILQNGQMENHNLQNGFDENEEPIPYINTDFKTSDNKPKNKPKKENTRTIFDNLIDNFNLSDKLKEKMSEWITYKIERKEQYKDQGMKSLLKQIENKYDIYDDDVICELIDECMANNWKGIIWDKLKDKPQTKEKENKWDIPDSIYYQGE